MFVDEDVPLSSLPDCTSLSLFPLTSMCTSPPTSLPLFITSHSGTEAGFNADPSPTVCDYCSTGDLYTYWQMIGQFSEDTMRVFAAELGCALGAYATQCYSI